MLGKLIKYEFRASGRLIPLVYLVVGLLMIAGMLLSFSRMYVYMGIAFVLLFLAGATAMIITYVVIFLRFHRGMFGGEGYLAMTLPVTPTQLYLSKTIVACCWMTLSAMVTVGSWVAAFAVIFRDEVFESMHEVYSYAWGEASQVLRLFFSPGMVLFFVAAVLVGYLAFVSKIFFCVTLSNVRPFQRLGIWAAIIAYVVLLIVNQIISTVLTMNVPFSLSFSPSTGWYLAGVNMWESMANNSNYSSEFTMGLASYVLAALFAFVLPILTIRLIERKVNLK